MREGKKPFDEAGINPRAPGVGFKKFREKSNPEITMGEDFKNCQNCGKIVAPMEIHKDKWCKDCADQLKKCSVCGKEFMPKKHYLNRCPTCEKAAIKPKICRKCGKEFIAKKSYYHTCPDCI